MNTGIVEICIRVTVISAVSHVAPSFRFKKSV